MVTPPLVKVLLVDDRPENLVALEAILAGPEYELVKAGSGADALRYLLENDCAIILLDVQMPELDGFETARIIKQGPRTRDIPIIFVTAVDQEQPFVARGYEAGCVDYVKKPLVPEILRAKVAVFASLHRSREMILAQERQLREHERRERQQALAELEVRALRREQQLQRHHREIVDGIAHAIVWAAEPTSLALTFLSASIEAIAGYRAEEVMGTPAFLGSLLPTEDAVAFVAGLRSLRRREPWIFEHRLIRADGEQIWMRSFVRLEPKLDAEGVLEVRGLSVDITEAKSAEQALRFLADASAQLASLDVEEVVERAARLPVPSWADWCTVAVVRRDAKEVPGLACTIHADAALQDAARALAAAPPAGADPRAVLESGTPLAMPCLPAAAPLGTAEARRAWEALAPRSMMVAPLRLRGEVSGYLALHGCQRRRAYAPRDLLMLEELAARASQAIENALLYRRAEEAIQLRDEFLSIASHELKTPLTPLALQLDGVQRALRRGPDAQPPEQTLERIASATRHIKRLVALVDSLLDVTRIRTGKLEMQLTDVDLSQVVREVVARFQPELQRSTVAIALRCDEPAPGRWDRERVDQVVTNLLSNALKYGKGQPIEIRAERRGDEAVLVVADRGIGISQQDQERIFARFQRAAGGGYAGLGLGLYIAHQIVAAHGGRIAVESGVGAGSTFTVVLPCHPRPAARAVAALTAAAS